MKQDYRKMYEDIKKKYQKGVMSFRLFKSLFSNILTLKISDEYVEGMRTYSEYNQELKRIHDYGRMSNGTKIYM